MFQYTSPLARTSRISRLRTRLLPGAPWLARSRRALTSHHAAHQPFPRALICLLGLLVWNAAAFGQARPDLTPEILQLSEDISSVTKFHTISASESRIDRLETLYAEHERILLALDFDALSTRAKADYLLMRNFLRARRAYNALERRRLAEIDPLLPFRGTIIRLEESRWRMDRVDSQTAAGALALIPAQVKAVRARIERGRQQTAPSAPAEAGGTPSASPPSNPAPATDSDPIALTPVQAQRAAGATSNLRAALDTWFNEHDGYMPEFSWWVRKPMTEARAALDDYARFLREDIAKLKGEPDDPLIGDPIGRETLLEDLAAESIVYSPEDLIAIAEREFAWCETEMRRAAHELGLGEDFKAALARVKENHVAPGDQAALVTDQAREAIQFLKDRDLLTIPPLAEELWRLSMIPPATARVLPFAAYNQQHIMVGYPADQSPHNDKLMSMRGNNRHFSRIVVPHELIPGHHLQLFVADRVRPERALFRTPFFVEGWALYWEMKLWDLGWGASPEDRIGMLFWRMHRCARIIISLKFHLGQMTPPEMIDFLVERVGHERFTATSEVRRYVGSDYSPLYQVGYMIGGLQVRALHLEAQQKLGIRERQFNDLLLTYNSVPLDFVRAEMLNLPLTREYAPSWRFGDAPANQP